MIEPLPNCFSICDTALFNAVILLLLSAMDPPTVSGSFYQERRMMESVFVALASF